LSSRFNETPTPGQWAEPTPSRAIGQTPTQRRSSRWDDKTPTIGSLTPSQGFTPTPMGMMTPTPGSFGAFQNLTPQKM